MPEQPKVKLAKACVNCRHWDRGCITPLNRAMCKVSPLHLFKHAAETCSDWDAWAKANNTLKGREN